MTRKALLSTFALLCGVLSAPAPLRPQTVSRPEVTLPLMQKPPVVDGVIGAGEWAGAARMEGLNSGKDLAPGRVGFWFGSDGDRLFLAMESETPPGGRILMRATPAPGDTNVMEAFSDDSFELVLDPLRSDPARRRLFHVIMNAAGAMYTMRHALDGGGEGWRGRWEIANKVANDRWSMEASVKIADLGLAREDLKRPMGVRVCRNWRRTAGPVQTQWSPISGPYLAPETMPTVVFDDGAPVVQTLRLAPAGYPRMDILVSATNPGAAPLPIAVLVRSEPSSSAHSEKKETVVLAPGERREFALQGPSSPQERIYTRIRVSSPDGGKTYYARDFVWGLERPDPFFLIDTDAEKQIACDYAYYPYHNTVKVRVSIAGVPGREKATGATLSVRRKGAKELLSTTPLPPFKDWKTTAEAAVPALPAGEYELVLKLEGTTVPPAVFDFVRHSFPWEKNRLGKSDAVVPPFTPMKVSGRRVETILRSHAMNDLCLWDQITTLGKPLLKAPMAIEAVVGGAAFRAKGSGFRTEKATATRASMRSDWSAGPLRGTTRAEWEYDGVMRWTLTVEPCTQTVEKLVLRIPLDDALMQLMHTCTDGIRLNYAGAVPAGRGVVWDGTKAGKNSIVGSYVPYIWIGAEERGFSVFGENDRGWVTDYKAPLQEMVRDGGTLVLALNLVAVPSAIEKSRTIGIGFQATPIKPMPEDWRRWVFGATWKVPAKHDVKRISFIGSCYYFGSEDAASEIYPRGHDLTIWEKFAEARRTKKADTAYIEEWMKGYGKILDARAGTDEARRKSMLAGYRAHINAGFNMMAGAPEMLNVYTNARGVRFDTPEGRTFLDEWNRHAFPSRKWGYGGAVHYDLDPTESFRDYAMWYYAKMLDTFMDSIYWDDIFMTPCFDTVGTDAYELPGGAIQPAAGLYNMRELVRRAAVMMTEKKRDPVNMVHMTNTAIGPILSFARMNFTWEDKVGALDFQDRYSREYIRAESIGLQSGNVPFCLWLISGPDKEKNAWADRTGAGVALTHEIKPNSADSVLWTLLNTMFEFGYGAPGVAVSQYWKEGHPARIEGSDAVTLLLHKPGSAMVVVSDWGNGGDVALILDAKKLGFAGKKISASNAETGAALETDSAACRVRFSMKKHDVRLIRVDAE